MGLTSRGPAPTEGCHHSHPPRMLGEGSRILGSVFDASSVKRSEGQWVREQLSSKCKRPMPNPNAGEWSVGARRGRLPKGARLENFPHEYRHPVKCRGVFRSARLLSITIMFGESSIRRHCIVLSASTFGQAHFPLLHPVEFEDLEAHPLCGQEYHSFSSRLCTQTRDDSCVACAVDDFV